MREREMGSLFATVWQVASDGKIPQLFASFSFLARSSSRSLHCINEPTRLDTSCWADGVRRGFPGILYANHQQWSHGQSIQPKLGFEGEKRTIFCLSVHSRWQSPTPCSSYRESSIHAISTLLAVVVDIQKRVTLTKLAFKIVQLLFWIERNRA